MSPLCLVLVNQYPFLPVIVLESINSAFSDCIHRLAFHPWFLFVLFSASPSSPSPLSPHPPHFPPAFFLCFHKTFLSAVTPACTELPLPSFFLSPSFSPAGFQFVSDHSEPRRSFLSCFLVLFRSAWCWNCANETTRLLILSNHQ